MEIYRTVNGTKKLNEYIQLGWKRLHIFTVATEFDDEGKPVQHDAAFVIVWDAPGEPVIPAKQHQNVEPLGVSPALPNESATPP